MTDNNSRAETLHYQEFDSLSDAEKFIDSGFEFQFSFKRDRIEYKLGDSLIYLEDIGHLSPTVEIVAQSNYDVSYIFNLLEIDENNMIYDSVPVLVERKIAMTGT